VIRAGWHVAESSIRLGHRSPGALASVR
jgi:hypothetical protein